MVLDPCYAPGYRNFDVCFLFCCALESSYLGRLSAIKVQLELEYFDCEWVKNLPKRIYLKTNMCFKISTKNTFQIQEFSKSFTERYEEISTEVYEKSTTVLPIQISRFIPVYSKEISYFSQEMHTAWKIKCIYLSIK